MSHPTNVRASRPAPALKSYVPWNGMDWGEKRSNITRHGPIDVAVVTALQSLKVPIQKRQVQIELTNLVKEATAFARNVVSIPGRDVDRSDFLADFRQKTRLGKYLSASQFEQLFTAIVLARYQYHEEGYLKDLPVESPDTHCQLARAVDAFETTAWFWSSVEAFLEDDHERAEDIERNTTLASDSDEGNNQGLATTSSAATTIASAAATAGGVGSEM